METSIQTESTKPLNVLLIGNNPIELSAVLEKLQQVRDKKIITEIAFDLKGILERLIRFDPNFIFIDDNLGNSQFRETVSTLSSNRKTKDVPITVLKNSNYHEAAGAGAALDYLLKQNLSADALYNALKNSLKFRRTQLYLYQAYQKRKKQIGKLI